MILKKTHATMDTCYVVNMAPRWLLSQIKNRKYSHFFFYIHFASLDSYFNNKYFFFSNLPYHLRGKSLKINLWLEVIWYSEKTFETRKFTYQCNYVSFDDSRTLKVSTIKLKIRQVFFFFFLIIQEFNHLTRILALLVPKVS